MGYDLLQEGKRVAIIVGINEYEDRSIPRLMGAENDAREFSEKLKNYGNFEIRRNHFLLGREVY